MIHSQAGEPKSLSDRVMSGDEVLRCAPGAGEITSRPRTKPGARAD
jgi:hypothetical protein